MHIYIGTKTTFEKVVNGKFLFLLTYFLTVKVIHKGALLLKRALEKER